MEGRLETMSVFILRYYIWYYGRWLLVIVGAIVLSACQSSPKAFRDDVQNRIKSNMSNINLGNGYKMDYLTSNELKEDDFFKKQSETSRKSNLGALMLTNSSGVINDDTLVTLYRNKRQFMAETKIYGNRDRSYFMAFGFDRGTKLPALAFRVEF